MEHESSEDFIVAQKVNLLFEDNADKTTEERIGAAAFNMLTYIDEEQIANSDTLAEWMEKDKDARKEAREKRRANRRRTWRALLTSSYIGMGIPFYQDPALLMPPMHEADPESIKELPPELSDDLTRLEEARRVLAEVQIILGVQHQLKPWEIKRAEAIARGLSSPKILND